MPISRADGDPEVAGSSRGTRVAAVYREAVDPTFAQAAADSDRGAGDVWIAARKAPGDDLRRMPGSILVEAIGRRGRWRRGFRWVTSTTSRATGAARAGVVLAGDAVAVAVESIRVAREQVFLCFCLAREISTVEIGGGSGAGQLCAEPQRDQDDTEQEAQGLHLLPFTWHLDKYKRVNVGSLCILGCRAKRSGSRIAEGRSSRLAAS